nr:MAG TPA_asm: tail tube protein [Caudoviricetes sp.]
MAVNVVPEVINDMRVYLDGADDMIGCKEFKVPELSALTADVEGIGVAGKISAPIEGHFDSMEAELTWQLPTKTSTRLVAGRTVSLDAYADLQSFDSGASEYAHEAYHVVIRGRVKSHEPGSLKAGEAMESKTTVEVHYIKISIGDTELCEIDKYGYKAVVNGIDLLEQVRKNIGM